MPTANILSWHHTKNGAGRRSSVLKSQLSDQAFRLLVDSTIDYAIFMLNTDGHIVSWNVGAERLKGYEADEVIGQHFSVFYPEEVAASGHPERELALAIRDGSYSEEGWRVKKDGTQFWAHATITALYDEVGDLVGFGKVTRDLSERRQAEEQILFESTHDHLTGLPNHTLASTHLKRSLAKSRRVEKPVAVLNIDLDRFRWFNESWGYEIGNEILAAVASRIKTLVRPYDLISRIAADQFLVAIEELSEDEADQLAIRIERAIGQPIDIGGRTMTLTCSIGLAFGTGSESADELISAAESAMEEAKSRGRAQHFVYRPVGHKASEEFLAIDQQLRTAVDNEELRIEYQPVVDITTGKVMSLEALTYWDHPALGRIAPGDFVPVAESSGIIRAIGDWVLMTACRQVADASVQIPEWQGGIAVNASAFQLFDLDFVDRVKKHLDDSGLDPRRLCLEVTESVLVRTDRAARDVTRRIQDLGVRLSLDDFGTGYASLSYLRELRFDVVKVDRTFVKHLASNQLDQVLTRAIIDVGSVLGVPVIIEGVETEEQLELVRRFGGTLVQGYYFQRPKAWEVTEAAIRSGFSPACNADTAS